MKVAILSGVIPVVWFKAGRKWVFMTVVTQLYLGKPWNQVHVSTPNWVGHHQVENKKNNRENHTTQHVTYVMFGRGEGGGTRSRFYNALGCVRLCRGDMDPYAICGLGHCVFCRYDDLFVEGVFRRCLWAWEREEGSIGRSVLGVSHMSHVTSSLWSFVFSVHMSCTWISKCNSSWCALVVCYYVAKILVVLRGLYTYCWLHIRLCNQQ
jgi:hypothetical protein